MGIRAEDVRVHAGELEPDVNFVAVHLLRMTERPRTVRLEFAGGIAAVSALLLAQVLPGQWPVVAAAVVAATVMAVTKR